LLSAPANCSAGWPRAGVSREWTGRPQRRAGLDTLKKRLMVLVGIVEPGLSSMARGIDSS